jgi:hypothetical protein
MPKTILEKLQDLVGTIYAFDGHYVVWSSPNNPTMLQSTHDLRDVLSQLRIKGLTLKELIQCLPTFDPPKRSKVSVKEE